MNPPKLSAFGATHNGLVRQNNEDRFQIEPNLGLYVLADGMGGALAGEVASQLAVETTVNLIRQSTNIPTYNPEEVLGQVFDSAHTIIRTHAAEHEGMHGMGTTLVVAWQPGLDGRLWLGHVGDSRAYLLRGGWMEPLTQDHTFFNMIERAGKLPADPRNWPPRNILAQALGASTSIVPDVCMQELMPGDRLLLCSDGLTDAIAENEIQETLNLPGTPAETCQRLIERSLHGNAKDNITVVVVVVN